MERGTDLESLEREAYASSYSDGIIDILVGVSLIWIGAAWIWLPDFAGLAGVLPAVAIPSVYVFRKQFVQNRAGYVKWSPPRQRWEKRSLALILSLGIALFALGVLAFIVVDGSLIDDDLLDLIMPGLLAYLLALCCVVLGFVMQRWRLFAYAAVLVGSGVVAGLSGANPGWPLLIAGLPVTVVGFGMLARYINDHPVES